MSADSSIKKNEMTLQQPHRGMVAVAGPAAGDSYPCEGSDEEGGWGGNTGYAIQVYNTRWKMTRVEYNFTCVASRVFFGSSRKQRTGA